MVFAPLSRLLRLLPLAAIGALLAGTSTAAASPEKVDEAFLWRVDGGERPSYLFGTIHAGVDVDELPSCVGEALDKSQIFVLEASPGAEIERFTARGQRLPMDFALAREARQQRMPVASLETPRFQMQLLSQVANNNELAAMLSGESDDLEIISAAYRSGDFERIAEVSDPGDPEMRELLLTTRNRRWVRQLRPVLQRGGAFVAVGVGHCPGDEGLLQLLRNRGYTLTRTQ